MESVYVAATILGASLVAGWAYHYFPGPRPRRLASALAHVLLSGVILRPGREAVRAVMSGIAPPWAIVLALVAITVPVLSYLFLSWIWLVGCLHDRHRPPRGGHPATAND